MNTKKAHKNLELIKKWRIQVSKYSYEESLEKLDKILLSLQNESIPIDDIQTNYLKANILLKRCETLLKEVEQDVLEIDPDLLDH